MVSKQAKGKAWIVAADMGYGHQRAAYPLKDIAYKRIINANSDKIISPSEKKIWNRSRGFYEWISKIDDLPVIGHFLFGLFDKLQNISPYYPHEPSTKPSVQVRILHRRITKGFGKSLVEYLRKERIPMFATFFVPALAANYYKLPLIYCMITDTDINRVWAPKDPSKNTIKYFVPCKHAFKRMLLYGIKANNLYLTGFPLPKENIGGIGSPITKKVLSKRIINLDPSTEFIEKYYPLLKKELGKDFNLNKKPEPVTITYVIGGAGAQKEIGVNIIKSLKSKIKLEQVNLCIVSGTHLDLKQYYLDMIEKEGLTEYLDKNLSILSEITKKDYFAKFNQQLNKTDILWTKPSELSFYSGLGLPIIIAPSLGAQEKWNRNWLHEISAGIDQLNPKYFSEWLDEWLSDGRLARKAWNGYMNAPRLGTYKIEAILKKAK